MLLDEDPPELFPKIVYSDQSVLESGTFRWFRRQIVEAPMARGETSQLSIVGPE